jgi:hypothetical protein
MTTRRNFLKSAGAAVAAPLVLPARIVFGANTPSQRVTTAHIGVGGQGGGILGAFLGVDTCQVLAVCDPFQDRRESRREMVDQRYGTKGCQAYNDFREVLARGDIDAVVIATPDHWHVPISLAAVRAGKDVYCEKPLGISIEQNKTLRAAVHRHAAIFQYGTQQRSFSAHCGFACELVRNGYLGEIKALHVIAPNGARGGDPTPQPVPDGLDYDLWLGPAPVMPYTRDRVIGGGRWHIYDYAIGFIAGWGAHPLDIAHWGYPQIPIEYEGTGVIPTAGLFDTVVDWDVRGRYAGGAEFTLKAGSDLTTFVGTEGWIQAGRGRQTLAAEPASLLDVKIKPEEIHLLQHHNHYANFIQGCLTRKPPASDIDSAVQSDFISHLGDIAIRTGRTIQWDPVRETIIGDETAARMMHRALREPWTL